MASNCPYWKSGKCAPPGISPDHDCSWPDSDYSDCAMYKMVAIKSAGGSMEDQLRGAGVIPPGAHVVGGGGRILSESPPCAHWEEMVAVLEVSTEQREHHTRNRK